MHKFLILLLFCLTFANAESGGSLKGLVKDPQGRPVAGAALALFSQTGAAGATTSDSSGAYHFEGLAEGDYLLRASAPGFAPFLADSIHLGRKQAETRQVKLEIAGVHEQVVVTASSTPQSPEHVSKAVTVIDKSEADARDAFALSDVVDLAPGVRVQQLGGPGAFTTIQIRGLRDQDTAVLVDGLRLRDASATQSDATGLIEDLLFTDSSRLEVMRGSGSSLYGTNAVGGVINVITDEGGGRTRGSLLLEGGSLGNLSRARTTFRRNPRRSDRVQPRFRGHRRDQRGRRRSPVPRPERAGPRDIPPFSVHPADRPLLGRGFVQQGTRRA